MDEILTLCLRVLTTVLTISFSYYAKFVAIVEGKDEDWPAASLSHSVLSSSRQTGTVSVSLQWQPKSICWSPTPLFPHSWTRFQDTWTFPLGAATRPWLKVCSPLFPGWDQRPQTRRSQYSPLHTLLQTAPANRLTSGESGDKMIREKPAQPIQEKSTVANLITVSKVQVGRHRFPNCFCGSKNLLKNSWGGYTGTLKAKCTVFQRISWRRWLGRRSSGLLWFSYCSCDLTPDKQKKWMDGC